MVKSEKVKVWGGVFSGERSHVNANSEHQCLQPGQNESTPALFVPYKWEGPSDTMESVECRLGNFLNIKAQSFLLL